MIHKNCLRCGRKLKSKEQQELGYGKTCYKKIQITKQGSLLNGKYNSNDLRYLN